MWDVREQGIQTTLSVLSLQPFCKYRTILKKVYKTHRYIYVHVCTCLCKTESLLPKFLNYFLTFTGVSVDFKAFHGYAPT